MIVGHLPFLGHLVSQLVVGDANRAVVQVEAEGLVAMQFQDGLWKITCLVDPELIP
jgi:phosphohistidine phosphatase SixA